MGQRKGSRDGFRTAPTTPPTVLKFSKSYFYPYRPYRPYQPYRTVRKTYHPTVQYGKPYRPYRPTALPHSTENLPFLRYGTGTVRKRYGYGTVQYGAECSFPHIRTCVVLLIYDRFCSCLNVFIQTHRSFLLSTLILFSFCVGWSVLTIFCPSSILNSCFCTHLAYPSLICIAGICWKRGALELWELWNLDWIVDRLHATCWKGCECTRARCKCLWQAVKICHVQTR